MDLMSSRMLARVLPADRCSFSMFPSRRERVFTEALIWSLPCSSYWARLVSRRVRQLATFCMSPWSSLQMSRISPFTISNSVSAILSCADYSSLKCSSFSTFSDHFCYSFSSSRFIRSNSLIFRSFSSRAFSLRLLSLAITVFRICMLSTQLSSRRAANCGLYSFKLSRCSTKVLWVGYKVLTRLMTSSGMSRGKSLMQTQKDGIGFSFDSMVEAISLSLVLERNVLRLVGEGVDYFDSIIKLYRSCLMDPSVSIEYERLALEVKYLLSLEDKVPEEQALSVLNQLYPFNIYPLKKVPPLEYVQYEPGTLITSNLRQVLESYSLVIILGKCKIQKQIYSIEEQQFIQLAIRDRLVFNFDEGLTQLTAINRVKLLKVHNIWVKRARQAVESAEREYIRTKLLKIPFFSKLSFEEFSKLAAKAELRTLGPGQKLVSEGETPYHMFVVTEGEISIRKEVDFVSEGGVWREVQMSLQKRDQYCQQLFQYLVRQPSPNSDSFLVTFLIKTVGEGSILCATETLNESPLGYSIISTLNSKYIAIKYPDLYVLEQSRLTDIRGWPLFAVDKRQLRRQYYYEKNWEDYKEYLTADQKLTEMQAQSFYDFLRKEVNLSIRKYNYASGKVGEGFVTDSPAARMNRVKEMTYK